ncbi:hypothetical protein [Bradyrhizobium sp. UFLA05-112]
MASTAELLAILRNENHDRIPDAARFALIQVAEQIELLNDIERLDTFRREKHPVHAPLLFDV